MGGFYGSISLKTEDRATVRSALADIARRTKDRFLVSPPADGWICVYPSGSGQDDKISGRMARRLDCDLVHLISHDEDVFLYQVYRREKLVDRYSSRPDYFEEASAQFRRRQRGRPEAFLDLFGDEPIESIREYFAENEARTFSSESMTRFAGFLKIPHEVMTSYEYLMEGETEGITGWDDFQHVPDWSREIARKRKQEDEVRERKSRLQEEGVLLVNRIGEQPGGALCHPIACPDRDGHGFLACLNAGFGGGTVEVERFGPPWSAGPTSAGFVSVDAAVSMLVPSPSGRFLAIGGGVLGGGTAVWDRDEARLVEGASRTGRLQWIGFLPDESRWVGVSKNEVVTIPLNDRHEPTAWKIWGGRHAAIHPSGQVIVVALDHNRLALLDMGSGRMIGELLMGGHSEVAGFAVMARLFPDFARKAQEVMARFDQAEVLETMARMRSERERRYEEGGIEGMLASDPGDGQLLREIREALAGLAPVFGPQDLFPGAESAMAMCFDDTGDWLFCATDKGVRAYHWENVVSSIGVTPAPSHSVTPDPYIEDLGDGMPSTNVNVNIALIYDTRRAVYDLAYDARRRRLLYSTMGGQVGFLNIDGGRRGILVEPPGRPPILRIHLSRDGTLLCCTCHPDRIGRQRGNKKPYIQIWDYTDLDRRLNQGGMLGD